MADTETTTGTESTEQKAESAATETPWGDDFDAARASKLVQNLRSERDSIKAERDSLKSERQAREDEGKTELQKLQDKLQSAISEAAEARRELNLQKVLRKFPELEDFADLLTGDTEEELLAKAERLAAIGKHKNDGEQESNAGDEQKDEQELPGMPKPDLKPGHGGDESAPFDPVAIAKAARR